jgi:hypothetical protein
MASPIQQPAALGPCASTGVVAGRPRAATRQLVFLIVMPIAAILAVAPIATTLVRFNLLVLRHFGIG